jgi:hypothetical protein
LKGSKEGLKWISLIDCIFFAGKDGKTKEVFLTTVRSSALAVFLALIFAGKDGKTGRFFIGAGKLTVEGYPYFEIFIAPLRIVASLREIPFATWRLCEPLFYY